MQPPIYFDGFSDLYFCNLIYTQSVRSLPLVDISQTFKSAGIAMLKMALSVMFPWIKSCQAVKYLYNSSRPNSYTGPWWVVTFQPCTWGLWQQCMRALDSAPAVKLAMHFSLGEETGQCWTFLKMLQME